MYCHIAAFLTGCLLDRIIGDPMWMPHPVRLIGKLIHFLDLKFMGEGHRHESTTGTKTVSEVRNPESERRNGVITAAITIFASGLASGAVILTAYLICIYLGIAAEAILTCYVLAAKSLKTESTTVRKRLEAGDIEGARRAVSMIVGRDTDVLDEAGIMRAAVETVAENTSDGVIAPLLYTFIGGPVLGLMYKAVNTLDSMIGYHNERYEDFGRAAARIDDAVNFIPARVSALLMTASAALLGKDYSAKGAWKIFKRDRFNHKSPNSAQTESVCAGALGLRLAGNAYYFGRPVKKPYIGDPARDIEPQDITRSCRLMYMTEFLAVLFCLGIYALTAIIVK